MKLPDKPPEQKSSKKGISLLIVDDSDFIRERLSEMIRESEIFGTISNAYDSESALKIYSASTPDIVILDIRIPGENGIKTLEKMKAISKVPKIIMLTNYPYDQYRKKCLATGADYFFSKSDDFGKIPALCLELAKSLS
jgi:two-component system, chemotaxis family, chemotaxis protein CheY